MEAIPSVALNIVTFTFKLFYFDYETSFQLILVILDACFLETQPILAHYLCGESQRLTPAHHGIRTRELWYERPTLYHCTTVFHE